jgi:predicted O-methyltransferase YrrM
MIPTTARLASQIDELERLAETRDDALQVPREEGELLAAIALAQNAQRVVEIGTSYGFSGLWWAAALEITGGHLHTIDFSEKKYKASQSTFTAVGVSHRITNYLGDAHEILTQMPNELDLVFIDADKPSSQAYLEIVWPKLRVGGSILTDNILTHRAELTEFVDRLRARSDAHSVLLPVGNGLEWTVKLR